jgi:hypothetical protein
MPSPRLMPDLLKHCLRGSDLSAIGLGESVIGAVAQQPLETSDHLAPLSGAIFCRDCLRLGVGLKASGLDIEW